MQCPPEIAEVICEILRTGLLQIRNGDDLGICQAEADHLHNLPGLLVDFKPELLDYYWTVERLSYIKHNKSEMVRKFERAWQSLAEHIERNGNATRTPRTATAVIP